MELKVTREELRAIGTYMNSFEAYQQKAVEGTMFAAAIQAQDHAAKIENWLNSKLGTVIKEEGKAVKVKLTLTGCLVIQVNPRFVKEALGLYGELLAAIAEPANQLIKGYIGVFEAANKFGANEGAKFGKRWFSTKKADADFPPVTDPGMGDEPVVNNIFTEGNSTAH